MSEEKKSIFDYFIEILNINIKELKAVEFKALMNAIIEYKLERKISNKKFSYNVNQIFNCIKKVIDNEFQKEEKSMFENNKKLDTKEIIKSDFEKYFWNLYPKKVNKQDALKAWISLFKLIKPSTIKYLSLIENISKGLKHWIDCEKSWHNDNGKYIMYPAKWLRNKNWESKIVDNRKEYGLMTEAEALSKSPNGKTIWVGKIESF